jgi:hypothetical protein
MASRNIPPLSKGITLDNKYMSPHSVPQLVQKMVGQIIYRYNFQVAKGDNPTNFTLWPPKKKENNGNIF